MLYRFTWFCIMSNIGYLAASPGFTWDTKRDVPRSAVGKSGPRRAQRSWREQHQKNNQMPPEGNGRFTQLAGIEALVHKNAKVEIYLFQLDSFGAIVSHVSPSNWQHRDKWFSSEYRKSAGNVNFRYKVKLWYIWHSGNLYGNCRPAAMQYPWGSIDKALTQSADDWRIVFERRFVEKSNIMHRSSPENLLFLPFTTLVHCEDVRDTSQNCWSPKWHSWRLSCRVQTVTPQHSTGCVCKIGNPILANHRYPHYNGYLEDIWILQIPIFQTHPNGGFLK